LAQQYTLAIATGRPAAEAFLPMRRHGLGTLFKLIYTLDDCLCEEKKIFQETGKSVTLSKPSPFMLNRIVEKLDVHRNRLYYVGDMPDDIKAAAASDYGFKSIGFLGASPQRCNLRTDLQRAGADMLVDTKHELEQFFLGSNQ
jgi:phosphoglycolate phosphatase-like HAD superfamily hydrolase